MSKASGIEVYRGLEAPEEIISQAYGSAHSVKDAVFVVYDHVDHYDIFNPNRGLPEDLHWVTTRKYHSQAHYYVGEKFVIAYMPDEDALVRKKRADQRKARKEKAKKS